MMTYQLVTQIAFHFLLLFHILTSVKVKADNRRSSGSWHGLFFRSVPSMINTSEMFYFQLLTTVQGASNCPSRRVG